MYLQLALLGVIGTGQNHGLAGGGHQKLQQQLFLRRVVKHLAVHGQGGLPVLFIHKGQQAAQLSKEFLLVNRFHLHWV